MEVPASGHSDLWPYPAEILDVIARVADAGTAARAARVNSAWRDAFGRELYRDMAVCDLFRGRAQRRALRSGSAAAWTRSLYVDAGHSCDECAYGGRPTLPALSTLTLVFARGIPLAKASVWPDDPCATLSRARPPKVVVRLRTHLAHAAVPALTDHAPPALLTEAQRIIFVTAVDPAMRGLDADKALRKDTSCFLDDSPMANITQIVTTSGTAPCAGFWADLAALAAWIAKYPPAVRITLVGLEACGEPPGEVGDYAGEGATPEGFFRRAVKTALSTDSMRSERQKAITVMPLAEYVALPGWEDEVSAAQAATARARWLKS